jgi:hypothetical protein
VAGFDLVFGAPKSVSLLHALGDEETRFAVIQAHTAAWQAALAYLEKEACVTKGGTVSFASAPRASWPPPTSTAPRARRTRASIPTSNMVTASTPLSEPDRRRSPP